MLNPQQIKTALIKLAEFQKRPPYDVCVVRDIIANFDTHPLKEAVLYFCEVSPKEYTARLAELSQLCRSNAVVQLITDLAPLDLLDRLQALEQEAGRVRLRHWGERTLDLDLLIYGDERIQNERLTVPHIGVMERDFVLLPLLDLDTELQLNGQSLKDLDIVKQSTLTVLDRTNWANI